MCYDLYTPRVMLSPSTESVREKVYLGREEVEVESLRGKGLLQQWKVDVAVGKGNSRAQRLGGVGWELA